MLMSFGYGLIGSFDGQPLTIANTEVDAARYIPGLGVVNYLDMYALYNKTAALPRVGPAQNQSWNFALIIKTPTFKEFYYDPDIQMQLLFDIGAQSEDSTLAVGVGVGTASAVAAIAATVSN